MDIVSLGEGEDVTVEMLRLYQKGRELGWSKAEYLRQAAAIPGLYIPALYQVSYREDGTVEAINLPEGGACFIVALPSIPAEAVPGKA